MNCTLAESEKLIRQLVLLLTGVTQVDVCLCPPFTALAQAKSLLGNSSCHLGAQNAHFAEKGAYTGEVSLAMLQELGCSYVIVGHSERRMYFGETDESVARKVQSAQSMGITPVLCVGESLDLRDSGQGEAYVLEQLRHGLALAAGVCPLVVSYEPLWAIGTGRAASASQVEDMLCLIKTELVSIFGDGGREVRLLYGGSVTAQNIGEFLSSDIVGGALVGGASLKAQEFAAMVRLAGDVAAHV